MEFEVETALGYAMESSRDYFYRLKQDSAIPSPVHPDRCLYNCYSISYPSAFWYENSFIANETIKVLKKVYNVIDPWDNNSHYFDDYVAGSYTFFNDIYYTIEQDWEDWEEKCKIFQLKDGQRTLLFEKLCQPDIYDNTFSEVLQHAIENLGINSSWEEEGWIHRKVPIYKINEKYKINYPDFLGPKKAPEFDMPTYFTCDTEALDNGLKSPDGKYLVLKKRDRFTRSFNPFGPDGAAYDIYTQRGWYLHVSCRYGKNELVRLLKQHYEIIDPWDDKSHPYYDLVQKIRPRVLRERKRRLGW